MQGQFRRTTHTPQLLQALNRARRLSRTTFSSHLVCFETCASSLGGGRRAGMRKTSPGPYSSVPAKADPARCASYHSKERSVRRTVLGTHVGCRTCTCRACDFLERGVRRGYEWVSNRHRRAEQATCSSWSVGLSDGLGFWTYRKLLYCRAIFSLASLASSLLELCCCIVLHTV